MAIGYESHMSCGYHKTTTMDVTCILAIHPVQLKVHEYQTLNSFIGKVSI